MKKIVIILSILVVIFGINCESITSSIPEPNITVYKNKPYTKLILFTELDIKNDGTRIYGIDPNDSTLKKHIHISNLKSDGADITSSGDIIITSRTDNKLYVLNEEGRIKQKVDILSAPYHPIVLKDKIFISSIDYSSKNEYTGVNLQIFSTNTYKKLKQLFLRGSVLRTDISKHNNNIFISNWHDVPTTHDSTDKYSDIIKMNINSLDTNIISFKNKFFKYEDFNGFAVKDSILYTPGIFNEIIAKIDHKNNSLIQTRNLKDFSNIRNLINENPSYFTLRLPKLHNGYLYTKIDLGVGCLDYITKFDPNDLSLLKLTKIEGVKEFSRAKDHIYYKDMFVMKYESQVRFIDIETGECVGKVELPVKKGTEPDYPTDN